MNISRKYIWGWGLLVAVFTAMAFIPMPQGKPVPYHLDKLFHLLTYTIMMAVATRYFQRRFYIVISMIALIFIGAAIELLQSYVPGRTGSLYDQLFNTLGVLLGWIVGRYWLRYSHTRNQ